jgi:hypothetical protein
VRLLVRLFVTAAIAALPVALAVASCGTDAVGVGACTEIEEARCYLAPLCVSGFDVQKCLLFYRDECLVGIQDTDPDAGDPSTLAPGCVAALEETSKCVDGGDGGCPGLAALLVAPDASCTEGATPDPTACNIIVACPEILAACAFLAQPDAGDGGPEASDDASDDGGDASDDASDDGGDASDDAGDAATD